MFLGKCVIEYPTLIIGPEEFMSNIELFVREINLDNNQNIVDGVDINEINLSPKRQPSTNLSNDSNELSIDSPIKKRRTLNKNNCLEEINKIYQTNYYCYLLG